MTKDDPQISLLGILTLFSFLFMGADCQLGCFKTIRAELENKVLPLQQAVNIPIQWMMANVEDTNLVLKKQSVLIAQLKTVKQQNFRLAAANQKTRALEYENQKLKALLNVSKMVQEKLLVANLLQVSADPFSHYLILDKGQTEGVQENQAIIDTQGVIGLVNSANRTSSKIRLITDKAHAVPVQNIRNGLRGIVSGTGKFDALILLHAPLSADYQVGDLLLTSGLGGRFPAGYPVGTVQKVQHLPGQAFTQITVKPLATLEKINQVLIVTGKVVDIKALAKESEPPVATDMSIPSTAHSISTRAPVAASAPSVTSVTFVTSVPSISKISNISNTKRVPIIPQAPTQAEQEDVSSE